MNIGTFTLVIFCSIELRIWLFILSTFTFFGIVRFTMFVHSTYRCTLLGFLQSFLSPIIVLVVILNFWNFHVLAVVQPIVHVIKLPKFRVHVFVWLITLLINIAQLCLEVVWLFATITITILYIHTLNFMIKLRLWGFEYFWIRIESFVLIMIWVCVMTPSELVVYSFFIVVMFLVYRSTIIRTLPTIFVINQFVNL